MGLKELFSLQDTDHQGTVEGIIAGVEFRGTNIWLLILAMLIASLGLNVNSPAVIIGAMLISPLMGPIAGAGLALGIYDWKLLKRSLINLGIMTIISLIASTLYFMISPLTEITPELQARTAPTFFDVLIALTGGIALIISISRKVKSGNPIAGVAIATALMPPLCTAGFGLATRNWSFFIGAGYLYLINSVFIGLAVFLFTKYLKLSEAMPAAGVAPKNIRWQHVGLTLLFGALFVVPSVYIGYDMIQESTFQRNAGRFVERAFQFPGTKILSVEKNRTSTPPEIQITTAGTPLSQLTVDHLVTLLPEFDLDAVKLTVIQSSGVLQTEKPEALPVRESPEAAALEAPTAEVPRKVFDQPLPGQATIPFLSPLVGKDSLPWSNLEQEVLLAFPMVDRILWGDFFLESEKPSSVFVSWRAETTPSDKERLRTYFRLRFPRDTQLIDLP